MFAIRLANPGKYHYSNITDVVRSAAPKRLNQGMIYRLHLYTPEQQLSILDEVASVGFKVLYEMPQMDNCNGSALPDQETSCLLHHDKTSAGYQLLNDTIQLIREHPALLGYYSKASVLLCCSRLLFLQAV